MDLDGALRHQSYRPPACFKDILFSLQIYFHFPAALYFGLAGQDEQAKQTASNKVDI
jgi:hypothetical protein